MRRIALVEPQCRGLQHVPFNAALLQTTRLAFPGADLIFAGESTHATAVREMLGGNARGVEFLSPFRPVTAGFVDGIRTARELALWGGALDVLILTSATPALAAALGWMRSRRFGQVSVFHACVAELNFTLLTQIVRNPLCMHTVARLPVPRRARNVVLGESILKNLHALGLARPGWCAMDHPVLDASLVPPPPGPVRFAWLSGFERTDEAVERVLDEVCVRKGASWVRVGRDSPNAPPLSASEYRRRLESAHYAVWMGEPEGYRLRASATFLDAIGSGRPLIFRRNDFIDAYHFSRGPVGIRLSGPAELEECLTRVVETGVDANFVRLSASAASVAKSFSCEQLAPAWREIVKSASGA